MPKKTKEELPTLDPRHYTEIHDDSCVSPELITERGAYTVRTKTELDRLGFSRGQQLPPGIAFPVFDVRGERRFTLYKPDEPRIDKRSGRPRKYEFPAGARMALDVPPRCREHLGDPQVPVVFSEGIKKVDALATLDLCAVGVIGTWNWRGTNDKRGKVALPDLEHIAFKDRDDHPRLVYLIFDSDIVLKKEVYAALQRFRELLKSRGADVWVVYLPEGPNGEKTGIDDFFARGGDWERVKALAQRELRRPPETDLTGQALVSKTLGDAPVGENIVVPAGYEIGPGGILAVQVNRNTMEESTHAIASAPVLIAGRTSDINSGSEFSELVYLRAAEWRRLSVSRATISNSRAIVELADRGVPVTSGNAGALVEFLHDFEAANLGHLPHAKTSSQMGWQGSSGAQGFLWGKRLLRAGQDIPDLEMDVEDLRPEDWPEDIIMFRGADAGDDQLAAGFTSSGIFEDWKETIRLIEPFDRAKLAVVASLAPPLLEVLGAYNFVIDVSNPTSRGKTATLRLAASCWGNPDERAPESVLGTWDATRVWIERASAILNSMPLMLDDTKRARYPKVVAQTLYDVASGRGRGRGSREGLGRSGSWSTVLLCTGEQPATSFTEDGGTRARVLTMWGSPFGAVNEEIGKVVSRVDLETRENYGHAGPRFIQRLLDRRDHWPRYRELHKERKKVYAERAAGDPVLGRMADYFATLYLTAKFATKAGILPWEDFDPVEPLWERFASEASEADRAEAALALVLSWAGANQHQFWGRQREDQNLDPIPPTQGYAGKWEKDDNWEYVGFMPHQLNRLLDSFGHDPASTVRTWRDRGWLATSKKGEKERYQVQARVDHQRQYIYAVKREVAERYVGAED